MCSIGKNLVEYRLLFMSISLLFTVNQTRTFIILFSCSIKVVVGAVILVDTHGRERSSATTRASSRDIGCRIKYPISLCSHFSSLSLSLSLSLSTSERVIRPETIWQQTFPSLIYFFFRFSSLSSSTLSRRGGSHSLVQRQRQTGGTNGLGTNHRVKIFLRDQDVVSVSVMTKVVENLK